MPKLPKYTLKFDEKTDRWRLKNDRTNKVVKSFESKGKATAGGAMKRALGREGGSVKIHKQNGRIQEERTFPGTKDPKKSKG